MGACEARGRPAPLSTRLSAPAAISRSTTATRGQGYFRGGARLSDAWRKSRIREGKSTKKHLEIGAMPQIIDGDDHIVEPRKLWEEYFEPESRDRGVGTRMWLASGRPRNPMCCGARLSEKL